MSWGNRDRGCSRRNDLMFGPRTTSRQHSEDDYGCMLEALSGAPAMIALPSVNGV